MTRQSLESKSSSQAVGAQVVFRLDDRHSSSSVWIDIDLGRHNDVDMQLSGAQGDNVCSSDGLRLKAAVVNRYRGRSNVVGHYVSAKVHGFLARDLARAQLSVHALDAHGGNLTGPDLAANLNGLFRLDLVDLNVSGNGHGACVTCDSPHLHVALDFHVAFCGNHMRNRFFVVPLKENIAAYSMATPLSWISKRTPAGMTNLSVSATDSTSV